jgi:DNA helicase HerA-like ATPase
VRLIRSKGVGIYFVTQNPLDIPERVLGQLGNRVQHALRAFTPRDQKAVRAAAETFRTNKKLDVASVIGELGVGEALVSFLDERGTPGVVQRAFVRPPESRLGAITDVERATVIDASPLKGRYEAAVDRHSAYEELRGGAREATPPPAPAGVAPPPVWGAPPPQKPVWTQAGRTSVPDAGLRRQSSDPTRGYDEDEAPRRRGGREPQSLGEAVAKSLARSVASSIGSQLGRQIMRGVLGSISGGGRRR